MNSKFNKLFSQILSEYNRFKPVQKLIYENLKIENYNKIISENIFSNQLFQNFFDQVNSQDQFQHYFKSYFDKVFPPNWKHLKQIHKSKKRGQLFIFKINYDKISIKEVLIKLLNYLNEELQQNILNEFINNITNIVLTHNSTAIFIPLENVSDFSMIFLDKNYFSMKQLKHQFGHYYQWLTGDNIYKSCNLKNSDQLQYPKNINKLLEFTQVQTYINLLMNDHEISPYINQLADYLIEYKEYRFNNLTNRDFIIWFFDNFINTFNTNEEYIQWITSSDLFKWMDNQIPLIVFTLANIYKCRILYLAKSFIWNF